MIDLNYVTQFVRNRIELKVVIAILVAAFGVWVFVIVAGEVLEGDTQGLDQDILLLLRSASDPNDPLGPPWVEVLGRDMTALGGTGILIMVTAFSALYLSMLGKGRTALIVLAAIASGFAMSQLLKWGFSRPRPDLVPHGTFAYTASFPSGHAMMSAVTYLTLAILTSRVEPKPRVRIFLVTCAVILTLLVGISRVYLAVHWPTDVLAGWTIGSAWAIGWWFVARWLTGPAVIHAEPSDHARERSRPPS
ncbi:phosphatase PAP2 family protein [Fulvimarina sp. 2208YS6-2-32]|uniref:Phosphatase PAP2 family protein n=1 Tax=Fulvimarina uroteuthidis TaxID=3098149 RepID=A0ABU5I4C5_9HYPH|nr:phosphatase PAP2 family protein [Fulvimarina sp. 2208YS6-2-32]MDY8109947.1 phosphatase PAP2 family protein [Fulvimarina sp. 2208YS6-2-32]